jgi:hypothetical protein
MCTVYVQNNQILTKSLFSAKLAIKNKKEDSFCSKFPSSEANSILVKVKMYTSEI